MSSLESEDAGLIPRLGLQLFSQVASGDYDVSVSMVEIYQEQLIDLLCQQVVLTGDHLIDNALLLSPNKELKLKEHYQRGVYIEGLTEASITSVDQILEILRLGEENRHVNSTKQNIKSSRSHSICTIRVASKGMHSQFTGLVNLVDLAGSERVSKSWAKGSAL